MTQSDFQFFRDGLLRHLDWFAQRGRQARFWWRDDDAIEPTAPLDTMLEIAERHKAQIGLAVIPRDASEALARHVKGKDEVLALQHGWRHKNFQRKDLGDKAAELGTRRDPKEVLTQLRKGRDRLEALFADQFHPILVPPWNRIAPQVAQGLPGIGLPWLSTFTWMHPAQRHQLQAHIDIIKWKKDRRFIGWRSAALRFDLQMTRRRTNPCEPIGILSHHLAHDEGCFEFLDRFLEIARTHPGASFPQIKSLSPIREKP